MKKKISCLLRKAAGHQETHYALMIAGLLMVCLGGNTINRRYMYLSGWVNGLIWIILGGAVIIHSIWFLEEILDAFKDD